MTVEAPRSGPGPSVAVSAVELSRVRVPLRNPLRSARVTQADRESILVRLVAADGVEGYSECPTLSGGGYVTEATDTAWSALVTYLVPAMLSERLPPILGAPAASAALADARLDADLRRCDLPMSGWLGEQTGLQVRRNVDWCAVLTDVSLAPGEIAKRAVAAVERGASWVKLKVSEPESLGATVQRVRAVVDVPMCVDANGSLSPDQVRQLDDLDLAYVEQPLPAGTPWDEMAALRAAVRTPIALDESLVTVDALRDATGAGAFDIASVKPSRIGGCLAAARAVELCLDRGIDCFVGGMLELGIGRAAALAVASLSGCALPADLGPSDRYFDADVCEPLVTDGSGAMLRPSGPGIGRVPDAAVVEGYLIDRVVLGGSQGV